MEGMTMPGHIVVIGYQPKPGVPLEDYPDFPVGRTFSLDEIKSMIEVGVLPPGILLRGEMAGKQSRICKVCGHYNEQQWVETV